ncbi:MAG: tRNA (adenosine(37)-N6)-dimethylallyltransferase MiaA [Actinobacteria bacterium]|nr:MAG: tRNA (adenosine(37)-N6)-dimethylallyltransferase MiaA [Actinomycetota bacterium]
MTLKQVAIVGSTASGKSAVAMETARRLGNIELISVDSMQVYRGMDIGTAKPTAMERADVAHHLLDLVDPTEEFTVAQFRAQFASAIEAIDARGNSALLVGGTGLYHRVVIDDFDLPGEWPEVRAQLDSEPDTRQLFERLETLDPVAAAKIEPGNRRRLIRALEVCIGSGRQFSSYGPGVDSYPDSGVVQIGLRWPREVIARRIENRVHRMIDDGLIAEVETIGTRGFSKTAAQALGYKEIVEYLDGAMSKDEAIEKTITRTRQFAVRQERWFRRDPRVRWIDVEDDPVAEAMPLVTEALGVVR